MGRYGKRVAINAKEIAADREKQAQKRAALQRTRARGIFAQALEGETFGKHPGYADLRIHLSVYNAVTQQEARLPGKSIELLVSSVDEVDIAVAVMRKALEDWIKGLTIAPV